MIIGGVKHEKQNPLALDKCSSTTKVPTSALVIGDEVFDPFFGIRIRSPRFSLDVFNSYCAELRKTKLSSLSPASTANDLIMMGVIVESTGIRKSANNKDYLIWHLNDLLNDAKVKVVMFGDAVQAHWKLQPGFVVAIANAETSTDNSASGATNFVKMLTLKVAKSLQVLSLGLCPDYGICTSRKKSGERCGNYVNLALSTVCVYHLQAETQRLRYSRGLALMGFNERPRSTLTKSPAKKLVGQQLFTVNRIKREFKHNTGVNLFTGTPARSIPKSPINDKVRTNSTQGEDSKSVMSLKPSPVITTTSSNASRNLINQETQQSNINATVDRSSTSQLSHLSRSARIIKSTNMMKVQPKSQFTSSEQAARKQAAEIFMKSQTADPTSRKRKNSEDVASSVSKRLFTAASFSNEQISLLLKKKSAFEHEVEQADRNLESRYFKEKEVEEKIETYATGLMEIKDVAVVTCKTCSYTAVHLAQRCVELAHDTVRHKATKRFYKCKDCAARVTCFSLMPTQPCMQCSGRDFRRVAMKDERKVVERDRLQIRGDERKFVNT